MCDKQKANDAKKDMDEEIYPVIDNDLAKDNLQNDIPAADLQDLEQKNAR